MEIKFLSSIWDKLTTATYSIYRVDENGKTIPYLEFDSIEECSFHGSSTATKYPVEQGLNIIDYKYANPDDLRIKGVVSKNGTFGIGVLGTNYSLFGQNKANLIKKIQKECNDLSKQMILVNIQTRNSGLKKNYTMVDYTIDETPENYNLLEVDMSFQEVWTFNQEGNVNRNVSDNDSQEGGIVETLKQNLGKWWNNDTNINQRNENS